MHDFGPRFRATMKWREKVVMTDEAVEYERKWNTLRGGHQPFAFTRNQRRQLKRWFDFLDEDGSGEIDATELRDPLLSTGVFAVPLLLEHSDFVRVPASATGICVFLLFVCLFVSVIICGRVICSAVLNVHVIAGRVCRVWWEAGIAQNIRDIDCLLGVMDSDTSGGIDFEEFLMVLKPPKDDADDGDANHAINVSGKAFAALQVRHGVDGVVPRATRSLSRAQLFPVYELTGGQLRISGLAK